MLQRDEAKLEDRVIPKHKSPKRSLFTVKRWHGQGVLTGAVGCLAGPEYIFAVKMYTCKSAKHVFQF